MSFPCGRFHFSKIEEIHEKLSRLCVQAKFSHHNLNVKVQYGSRLHADSVANPNRFCTRFCGLENSRITPRSFSSTLPNHLCVSIAGCGAVWEWISTFGEGLEPRLWPGHRLKPSVKHQLWTIWILPLMSISIPMCQVFQSKMCCIV